MNVGVQALLDSKESMIYGISPGSSLLECLRLLNEKRVGALIVRDESETLLGIISERDIMRTALNEREKMFNMRVSEVMTPRAKMVLANEDLSLEEIMELMTNNRVRHLPIVQDDRVTGMVSIGDVVKVLLEEAQSDKKHMENYILGHYA